MSFPDIKGQDKSIQILKEHLKQSRLANGYLFVGGEGVGKKLVAKTLAKTVNCQEELLDSCDKCASCLKIEKNQHPDVHIVDAATPLNINSEQSKNDIADSTAIKIGHIRQLQKDISLKAYEGKRKVFIIDNAHHLTAAASNALLKILEEPPRDSLIILISANPTLLFKTIISRCQVLRFSTLARAELEDILRKDYSLDNHLAHFLAYFCEGRLGRALSLKDTDILKKKNRIIDALALSNLAFPKGPTSTSQRYTEPALESSSIKNREELRVYLNILTGWFRDMYLIKIGMPHSELINLDRKTELLKFMPRFSFPDLDAILNFISESLLYLEQNVNIKLLLSNLKVELWKG